MSVNFVNTDYRIGAHVSKWAPSLYRSMNGYVNLPFTCFQIYTSNRDWKVPDYSNIDLLKTRDLLRSNKAYLCIHGSLLNNLCGSVKLEEDPKYLSKLNRVRTFVTRELDLGVALDAGIVVHPGSCKDKEKGLRAIADTVTHCLTVDTDKAKSLAKDMKLSLEDFKRKRKIILENASGGGTKLAVTLEEISTIIKGVPKELWSQVKVCIDTAHAFGAGLYKWGNSKEVQRFYKDFDRIIGLDHLEVFHLNDSRCSESKRQNAPFGSGKDVHEYLGEGYIFGVHDGSKEGENLEGLKELLRQSLERQIPMIGEPPNKYRNGEPGDDFRREWLFIATLLADEKIPLTG